MLRILLIDWKSQYFNPHQDLFRSALTEVGELETFGPGWVSIDTLRSGLASFVKRRGHFDVIIADASIANSAQEFDRREAKSIFQSVRRIKKIEYTFSDFLEVSRIAHDLRELPSRKAVSMLGFDTYNLSESMIRMLASEFHMVIGSSIEMSPRLDHATYSYPGDLLPGMNSNWAEFASEHSSMILPFPFFISDSELVSPPWEARPFDFCVPGQPYTARKQARRTLKRCGARMAPNIGPLVASAALRLPGNIFSTDSFTKWYQKSFWNQIRGSRVGYTCGGPPQFVTRKYFEIPASGTLLACFPVPGLNYLGFEDRKNCLFVKDSQDLHDLALAARNDDGHLLHLAQQGYEFVAAKHTTSMRVNQLRLSLEALVKGSWGGARFVRGEFELV